MPHLRCPGPRGGKRRGSRVRQSHGDCVQPARSQSRHHERANFQNGVSSVFRGCAGGVQRFRSPFLPSPRLAGQLAAGHRSGPVEVLRCGLRSIWRTDARHRNHGHHVHRPKPGYGGEHGARRTGGLYDFLFREQTPVQGRWLSPDPAGLAAADPANPQSWNRYAYVTNNPLVRTDPLGSEGEDDGGCEPVAAYGGGGCDTGGGEPSNPNTGQGGSGNGWNGNDNTNGNTGNVPPTVPGTTITVNGQDPGAVTMDEIPGDYGNSFLLASYGNGGLGLDFSQISLAPRRKAKINLVASTCNTYAAGQPSLMAAYQVPGPGYPTPKFPTVMNVIIPLVPATGGYCANSPYPSLIRDKPMLLCP